MLEQNLSREFHRVADAIPVPDNLMPTLTGSRPRRVPRLLAAAAVSAAFLLGFTPWGREAVRAASTWVSSYRVEVVKEARPSADARRLVNLGDLKVGETQEFSGDGLPKMVYRAMTVADLNGEWPLPTHMGPSADTKVILREAYDQGGTTIVGTAIDVGWRVTVDGVERTVGFSFHRSGIETDTDTLSEIQNGERAVMTVDGVSPDSVKQQPVTVHGREIMATYTGHAWNLLWYHAGGMGRLGGNFGLEELVRIAESLPSLE